jgi:hypothetical protein
MHRRERLLWTCLFDFRGGTYIKQSWAGDHAAALRDSLAALRTEVPELSSALRSITESDVDTASRDSAPIQGLHGVRCASISVDGDLLLANIVETALPRH